MPDDLAKQHGTEVAGIIAGSIENTIGTIGAAPDATITAAYLHFGSNVDMSELVNVLSQQSHFAVANNSWGFTSAFADNFQDGLFRGNWGTARECRDQRARRPRHGYRHGGRQRQAEYRRREPRRRRQLSQSVELAIRDRRRRPQCARRRGLLLEPRHQCPDLGAGRRTCDHQRQCNRLGELDLCLGHLLRSADGVERDRADARGQSRSRLSRHSADPGDHREAFKRRWRRGERRR